MLSMKAIVLSACLGVFFLGQQTQPRRDPVDYIRTLESERRVSNLQVAKVVESLKISRGQRIADLGSGSGLFSRPLAKAAGENGVVYAIDIDADLLKHVETTAREQQIGNIRTVLATVDDPKIPEPVDLIAIIDTLHHIEGRPAYLSNLKRYLRPQGRIAIIDFLESWPPGHESMKYTVADLDGWMKTAGYTRIEKHDFITNNFFVVYARSAQ